MEGAQPDDQRNPDVPQRTQHRLLRRFILAKITVKLPQGWDKYLIVDSKDFATLCDIFERSVGFEKTYHDGNDYCIESQFFIEGKSGAKPVISKDEFEQLKATPLAEAA